MSNHIKFKFFLLTLCLALSGTIYSGFILAAPKAPNQIASTATPVKATPEPPKEPEVSDIDQNVLLTDTNAHRAENGLPALILDDRLNKSALDKCNDMSAKYYWEHIAPDGTKPWYFIKKQNISYRKAGENLATKYVLARPIVIGWANSPTHNENLLDPEYSRVGFGVCKSKDATNNKTVLIVVQHFVGY
jgi:uncharacterized protein YkwD